MHNTHIWLRAEAKPFEQRTPLTPHGVNQLLAAGFKVTVEKSEQRIFNSIAYRQTDCDFTEPGSWRTAPAQAFILGLKELPEQPDALSHRHIMFAHAYKEQQGWQATLSRFKRGNGQLFDLEYLLDDNHSRVAAFGYWAGYAGAALGVLAWTRQQQQQQLTPSLANIPSYPSQQKLLAQLEMALSQCAKKPKILLIGAKGRSGQGTLEFSQQLSLPCVEWNQEQTRRGGPFPEINDADILVNCVFVNQPLPPFVTLDSLANDQRRLSMIVDVSCDPYGSYNSLPIYDCCTTFESPCISIDAGPKRLELIAVDHLPSLLPIESSNDYCRQLLPYLLKLDQPSKGVWPRALQFFNQKMAII
ncbi:MAG: saccharopine dehydrogenase [Motiliproteus sp.]